MDQFDNSFISETVREVLGSDEEFNTLLSFAVEHPNQPESIRINSLRFSVKEYLKEAEEKGAHLKKIQGSIPDAYYVTMEQSTRSWWNQERLMGKFYSQGNASMIPPIFLFTEHDQLNELKVLDMCAAPGSKSTQIGALMKNEGLLVANDFKSHRLYALHRNLQVFGVCNAVVTQLDGRWVSSRWPKTFDRTLLDAPCSGTGSSRNKMFSNRSEQQLLGFQQRQKGLLSAAITSLREKDSFLIYSTCSMLPQENELVLQPFIEKGLISVEPLPLNLLEGWKTTPGLTKWNDQSLSEQLSNAIRINPHWNDSDAFFVAKLQRRGE